MRAVERSSGLRRSTGKSRENDAQEKPFIVETGEEQDRRWLNGERRGSFRDERQESVRTHSPASGKRARADSRPMSVPAVAARRGAALVRSRRTRQMSRARPDAAEASAASRWHEQIERDRIGDGERNSLAAGPAEHGGNVGSKRRRVHRRRSVPAL